MGGFFYLSNYDGAQWEQRVQPFIVEPAEGQCVWFCFYEPFPKITVNNSKKHMCEAMNDLYFVSWKWVKLWPSRPMDLITTQPPVHVETCSYVTSWLLQYEQGKEACGGPKVPMYTVF